MYRNDLESIWEEVLLFLVPFWRLGFDTFWCCVLDLVIFSYFLSNIFNGAKCLIYINLCTFHVKKNSARLQWYSCARYKAPGPLVLLVHTIIKEFNNNCIIVSCIIGDNNFLRQVTNMFNDIPPLNIHILEQREKEGDLTQSYDKTPYTTENSKTKGRHINATKSFDYTTIADRLRTVSWSNESSNWCG